jgi:hypothetical protein
MTSGMDTTETKEHNLLMIRLPHNMNDFVLIPQDKWNDIFEKVKEINRLVTEVENHKHEEVSRKNKKLIKDDKLFMEKWEKYNKHRSEFIDDILDEYECITLENDQHFKGPFNEFITVSCIYDSWSDF